MKTPAIIASLTVAGSIAFAAGQQSGGKQLPPLMSSGAQAHSMQVKVPQARMAQAAGGCQSVGADKIWFTTVHPFSTNCFFPMLSAPADINGGGTPEYLSSAGGHLVVNGQEQQDVCPVTVNEVAIYQGDVGVSNSCVIASSAVTAYARAVFPQALCLDFNLLGLRDMDADGDLDLIGSVLAFPVLEETGDCDVLGAKGIRSIWIENTGYEKPAPPVAADLNRDGQVDGADLGMLLIAWGPNP